MPQAASLITNMLYQNVHVMGQVTWQHAMSRACRQNTVCWYLAALDIKISLSVHVALPCKQRKCMQPRIYMFLGINPSLVRISAVVSSLRLPRSTVGLSVASLLVEIQIWQSWLRAHRPVVVIAVARVVAWCPTESGSIGKEMAAIFFEASAVVVGGVLLCKRYRVVASGTWSEW